MRRSNKTYPFKCTGFFLILLPMYPAVVSSGLANHVYFSSSLSQSSIMLCSDPYSFFSNRLSVLYIAFVSNQSCALSPSLLLILFLHLLVFLSSPLTFFSLSSVIIVYIYFLPYHPFFSLANPCPSSLLIPTAFSLLPHRHLSILFSPLVSYRSCFLL